LAGTVTVSSMVPFEHGTVAGSPPTGLFEVNVQPVALVTLADTLKMPPREPSDDGVGAKEEMLGTAGLVANAAAGPVIRPTAKAPAAAAILAVRPIHRFFGILAT
jgi:hypothetical protein